MPHNRSGLGVLTSFDHSFGSLVFVLLEVLDKKTPEFSHFLLEVCLPRPALCRVEEIVRDSRALLGHAEVKGFIVFVLGLGKFSRVNCVEDSSCIFEPIIFFSKCFLSH